MLVVPAQHPDPPTSVQELPTVAVSAETFWTAVLEETKKLPDPTRGRDRTKIAELLADEQCSQAIEKRSENYTTTGPQFSRNHRRRKDIRPTGSRRRRREASEWEDRARE